MRHLFAFLCVCVLGLMPLVGCSETAGDGGSGGTAGSGGIAGAGGVGGMPECESAGDCDDGNECTEDACTDGVCDNTAVEDGTECGDGAGTCQAGSCVGTFSCTEQGIRQAIAVGGGPHTFECHGLTQVVTEAEIEIDNDVILDGEARLIVDGNLMHSVFSVPIDVTAELRGTVITRGQGGIINLGDLTLTSSWVVYNTGPLFGGIANDTSGTLHLRHSIVQGNVGVPAGGIDNLGTMTLTHSTVSENSEGIWTNPGSEDEPVIVINSTVSGNTWRINAGTVTIINSTVSCAAQTPPTHYCTVNDSIILIDLLATVVLSNTLIHGTCVGVAVSSGYNMEVPGHTCGLDQPSDLNIDWVWLGIEPLAYNGGWAETHALRVGSAAINRIPTEECVDADGAPLTTDQRGFPRPVPSLGADPKCDVGAFELQGGTGVPAGWTCPPENYGAGDGCHCGCGVIDLDCADGTGASCDYCGGPGSCSSLGCPGDIDQTQNWTCWS